jgi:hypothetical protein
MKLKFSLLTILTILAISSCNTPGSAKREIAAEVAPENNAPDKQTIIDKAETVLERKTIKQGDISFRTSNIRETESLINRTVNELGGYVTNDNTFVTGERITHRIIIRVPADRFDQLLTKISESAGRLESKNVNAQDVTEEYIDIESRIKTKKELENQYKELLMHAKSVQEILTIEKEMGALRTEIESIEGRLQYLKDRVSFSTLTVEYYQLTSSPFGFGSKLGQALETGWKFFLTFIIGLLNLWPFILIIGGTIFIAFRISGKRKKINKS